MVHELAHQWFGDSVTPAHLVRPVAERGPRHLVRGAVRGGEADRRWQRGCRRRTSESDALARASGPPGRPHAAEPGKKISIFRPNVYDGSALVLYALREEIGGAGLRAAGAGAGSPGTGTAPPPPPTSSAWPTRSPEGPECVPRRLALRREDPADARPPGLDGRGRAGKARMTARAGRASAIFRRRTQRHGTLRRLASGDAGQASPCGTPRGRRGDCAPHRISRHPPST